MQEKMTAVRNTICCSADVIIKHSKTFDGLCRMITVEQQANQQDCNSYQVDLWEAARQTELHLAVPISAEQPLKISKLNAVSNFSTKAASS
jgi:hypothetical protein